MISLVLWYLAIVLIGWMAVPLAFRVLRFLPDRGALLAKPLGLLVWGFIFWLLASLHVIQNDGGGILVSLILFGGLAIWAGKGRWAELRAWLAGRRGAVITSEVLFLLAFLAWALIRAAGPDATGTEKPMELAFINAILHSPVFPPHDPWLSGYAISYYYFGYVLVAMLARLTAISGGVAFNLGVASWFALTASAAYAVLFNLLETWRPASGRRPAGVNAGWALLAPLFILLVSNLDGPLEVLHASGAFWQPGSASQSASGALDFPPQPKCGAQAGSQQQSSFWSWISIQELYCPPSAPLDGVPKRAGGIWWWRASRVLTDYDLNNGQREVIDEFPAFSYLLGDLHPHVLSMPFVLLAIGLALNLYLRTLHGDAAGLGLDGWPRQVEFWLAAVVLGGLAFLNTWDFPIYVALYSAAYTMARVQLDGWRWLRLGEFAVLGIELGLGGIVLYLPFYIGFASQAGGIIPSLSFFTRGVHFWVMFALLLVPIGIWLLLSGQETKPWRGFWRGLLIAAGLVFGLWVLSYAFGWLVLKLPNLGALLVGVQGGVEAGRLLGQSLARRLAFPGAWISLLVLLSVLFHKIVVVGRSGDQPEPVQQSGALSAEEPVDPNGPPEQPAASSLRVQSEPIPDPSKGFVLLLVLLASGLVLFPEFFYLRDQFGWRMNTIFKFYFQAWILWGIAAAFASVALLEMLRGLGKALASAAVIACILLGLVYPFFLIPDKLHGLKLENLSLDGSGYLAQYQPEEYQAIQWLSSAAQGAVAEAVGGSYDPTYARVATHSGQPSVLGWPGHEGQWRGGGAEIGSREQDIQTLYTTADWNQAKSILLRYHIRYIYVGSAENSKYRVNLTKFTDQLPAVFSNKSVEIFMVPDALQ